MSEKSVEQVVMETVAKVFQKKVTELTPDTRFLEDLFAKSVNVLALTSLLEYELNIPVIPMAQARRAKTIREAIDLVKGLM